MLPVTCALATFAALQLPPAGALREYELKHARVAMLAVPTLGALTAQGLPAVQWLSMQPPDFQLEWFALAGLLEAGATLPRFQGTLELRPEVEPGRFPPLGPGTPAAATAELAVGRTAMLAATAWLASAAVPLG